MFLVEDGKQKKFLLIKKALTKAKQPEIEQYNFQILVFHILVT